MPCAEGQTDREGRKEGNYKDTKTRTKTKKVWVRDGDGDGDGT